MTDDSATGEGVSMTPVSSAANIEGCTLGSTKGVDYEVMLDPGMQPVHHVQLMASDSVAANDEACVEPPLSPSA